MSDVEVIIFMVGYLALVEAFLWILFKLTLNDWKKTKKKWRRKCIKRKIAKRKKKRFSMV